MKLLSFELLGVRSLTALCLLVTISFFTAGGCNNGNGGGGGIEAPLGDTSACTILTDPCDAVVSSTSGESTVIECVAFGTTCGLNLDNLVSQIKANGYNVSDDSILWMAAWGGLGGPADNGGGGGAPGHAQFTTSVSDIIANYSTKEVYYFLGENARNGANNCGGAGGAATIVTTEDLTINPSTTPTTDLVLLVAGGGGGGAARFIPGCTTGAGPAGANGQSAISDTTGDAIAAGNGCNTNVWGCGPSSCGNSCSGGSAAGAVYTAEGGGSSGSDGGIRQCCTNSDNSTNGNGGIGGLGGNGGSGAKKCPGPGGAGFYNTGSVGLTFTDGKGGDGGGQSKSCVMGGGGGGGGYGGGGGGGRGNDNWQPNSGGAGGSYAAMSTQSTPLAPTSDPGNACTAGCFAIYFVEDQ